MEVVASLSQGRTGAAQCGLFTYKSVPVIFEPPCNRTNCSSVTLSVSSTVLSCKPITVYVARKQTHKQQKVTVTAETSAD